VITAKIIADSVSPAGKRITTMELVYPRFIHAEVMTHRAFSRNASSSRAIPVAKAAQMALDEMVFPIRWGLNQAGMQAKEENLDENGSYKASLLWERAARSCFDSAERLAELGLHKQWANRMLEWFSNIRVLVTSTEWDNFFELRDHEDAQDEIRILAQAMKKAMEESTPLLSMVHLPYILPEELFDFDLDVLFKVSSARCCRVSYLKHDGQRPSVVEDLKLFDKLAGSKPIHASPLEHQGWASGYKNMASRNFRGWVQYRELFEREITIKSIRRQANVH